MRIHAQRALIHGCWMENRVISVEDGIIRSVAEGTSGDLSAPRVTPGLFDKHVHGGFGFDYSVPDEKMCRLWLEKLLAHGVTNILYTLASCGVERSRSTFAFVAEMMRLQREEKIPGARIMGIHMEGPMLSLSRKGAMNAANIMPASSENFELLTDGHADIVRAITLAPDIPGALELAKELTARGIRVQAGHTAADYACMERAQAAGYTGLTHTFNAMPGIAHRDPGPVVYGMVNDGICLEAICDFVHLDPPVVKLLFKVKGADGIAMISDSTPSSGMPDGEYIVAGKRTLVRNSRCVTPDGGIDGSWSQLDLGVANVISLGFPAEDAIRAASATPARYLGLDNELGDIAPGMRACLAGWTDSMRCLWGFDGFHAAHAG